MKKEHIEMLKEIMDLEEKLDYLFLTRRERREFQLEVEELQRLAEIGRATEKLLNKYDGVKGFYKKQTNV